MPERARMLTLGQVTLDDIVTPGGTTHLRTLGGNALYSAMGAALWLGVRRVAPVCRIGRGFDPSLLRGVSRRLDLRGVRSVASDHVRSWLLYEPDGRRRHLGRNAALLDHPPVTVPSFAAYHRAYRRLMRGITPAARDIPKPLSTAEAVHLAPQLSQRHLANATALRRRFPLLSLDPSPEDMEPPTLRRLLPLVDFFLPSREEITAQQRKWDHARLVRRWTAWGARAVCIKLGAEGCLVAAGGHLTRLPAVRTRAVELTGAGDAFCGGFLAGYLLTRDAVEAAMRGVVSASFAVEGVGLQGLLRASSRVAGERLAHVRRGAL